MNDTCHRPSPCGDPCILSSHVTHTMHACRDPHCLACHGGAVHAANMLARRRETAKREQAEMDAQQPGLEEMEF